MVSESGKVVSAQLGGDLKERYKREVEERPDDKSKSQVLREVVEDGLDARGQSVYTQIGCEGELRATVEEIRRAPEESRQNVVVRLLREAVEARESDDTEKLADADLRDRVEDLADEGEPVDDAARRLLRDGVESAAADDQPLTDRLLNLVAIFVISVIPILNALRGDLYTAFAWVAVYAILFEFGDEINNQFARLKGLAGRVKS